MVCWSQLLLADDYIFRKLISCWQLEIGPKGNICVMKIDKNLNSGLFLLIKKYFGKPGNQQTTCPEKHRAQNSQGIWQGCCCVDQVLNILRKDDQREWAAPYF